AVYCDPPTPEHFQLDDSVSCSETFSDSEHELFVERHRASLVSLLRALQEELGGGVAAAGPRGGLVDSSDARAKNEFVISTDEALGAWGGSRHSWGARSDLRRSGTEALRRAPPLRSLEREARHPSAESRS